VCVYCRASVCTLHRRLGEPWGEQPLRGAPLWARAPAVLQPVALVPLPHPSPPALMPGTARARARACVRACEREAADPDERGAFGEAGRAQAKPGSTWYPPGGGANPCRHTEGEGHWAAAGLQEGPPAGEGGRIRTAEAHARGKTCAPRGLHRRAVGEACAASRSSAPAGPHHICTRCAEKQQRRRQQQQQQQQQQQPQQQQQQQHSELPSVAATPPRYGRPAAGVPCPAPSAPLPSPSPQYPRMPPAATTTLAAATGAGLAGPARRPAPHARQPPRAELTVRVRRTTTPPSPLRSLLTSASPPVAACCCCQPWALPPMTPVP